MYLQCGLKKKSKLLNCGWLDEANASKGAVGGIGISPHPTGFL